MQTLIDFLSFKTFISPSVLTAAYIIGALGIPIASGLLSLWVRRKFSSINVAYESGKEQLKAITSPRSRIALIVLFFGFFLSMEIMWRMMFEFMIAYFQMRDVLMGLGGASLF